MFKIISIAAAIALLSACSGMSGGSMSRSDSMSGSSSMGSGGGNPNTAAGNRNGDGPN